MEGMFTCIHELLIFSKIHSLSKITLDCYIVETAASIASNDVPYDR